MKKFSLFLALKCAVIGLLLFFTSTGSLFSQTSGEVVNLGLYGGHALDLTYCNTNNRLFAAVEKPGSLFYSDDHGVTWVRPLHIDSMEYDMGQRGWGGGARKIFTNSKGWVAVRTAQSGGTLTAAIVSFDEGDVNTFETAIDRTMLKNINTTYNANAVTGIGLSDHYMYIGLEKYLVRWNDTATYTTYNVIAQTDTIPGIGTDFVIRDMAVANDVTGFPVYMVLSSSNQTGGKIYKFDGVSFSPVSLISVHAFPHTIDAVFTHPNQAGGDTIIASLRDTFSSNVFIFLSTDAGTSWTNITPPSGSNWPLHSADYSPAWVASMPVSNGLRLSFPGGGVSDDLGANWTPHVLPDNAMATYPTDHNIVCGSYGRGVAFSSTGASGAFTITDNDGFEAIGITKIAQSSGVFYVSTNGGLGYTEAYFDPTVVGIDKWKAPYGVFPISGVGDDNGVTAVTVSPTDPLHVIAGHSNGFSVTTTGNAGFTQITPAAWNTSTANMDIRVMDVKFVNDQLAIAVTGTGSNVLPNFLWDYGNIWRTTDGGASWSVVTPTGFYQGTAVEVGTASGDTVLYATAGYWDGAFPKVNGSLWRSDDLGLTWSYIGSGPTGVMSGTTDMPIYDIDIDPRNNDVIYLASGQNLDFALVRSNDGGISYSTLPVMSHGAFSSVLVNRSNPDVVYSGARRNVFRYNNATGITMITFNGMPGEFVPDLENGSTLLATSTGFYKLVEDFGAVSTTIASDGDWSNPGNWTNGQPEYLKNVNVSASLSNVDQPFEMNRVTLQPDAALTIENSGFISLNDTLIIQSDASGYGSLLNEKEAGDIRAQVQNYLTDGQWHYVSPMTGNAVASSFYFSGGSSSWIKQYDEPSNSWQFINDLNHILETGRGYAVWVNTSKANETGVYNGVLNNNDIIVSLSYSGPANGWNLIGNPFPCALDWDNGDFESVNTTGIAYVYDNGNYLARNFSGAGTLTNGVIPAGQGFFVQANAAAASLTLNRAARVHASQAFYKQPETVVESLDITLQGNGMHDKTWVSFHENATALFDAGLDAVRLEGSSVAPKLYTMVNDQKLSINMLNEFESAYELPLYAKVSQSATYELSFDFVESFTSTTVTLHDLLTGTQQILNNNNHFVFTATADQPAERFKLTFLKSVTGIQNDQHEKLAKITYQKHQLNISWTSGIEEKAVVSVYSTDGRCLLHSSLETGSDYNVSLPKLPVSVVLVRINCGDKQQIEKIVLQ